MKIFSIIFVLFLLAVAGYCGEAVLLPTSSRVPTTPKYLGDEFDTQLREAIEEESLVKLVSVLATRDALNKFCVSSAMPLYSGRRLTKLADYLNAEKLYRVVIQKFSIVSRLDSSAEDEKGTKFYVGQLEGTVHLLNATGEITDTGIFAVKLDTRVRQEPADVWSSERAVKALVGVAVQQQVLNFFRR